MRRTQACSMVGALLMLTLGLGGCGGGKAGDSPSTGSAPEAAKAASAGSAPGGTAAAANPGGARPGGPVTVTTVVAQARDLPVEVQATGSIAALSAVEVRPQMAAVVREVLVSEGQDVRKGQVLFRLDARGEQAQVDRAAAQLARDEAALAEAQRQFRRSEDLLRQNFVSQGAVDANRTAMDSQAGAVAASKAALKAAQVTLSYGEILAQQSGRLGAIGVFPGSYVSPAGPAMAQINDVSSVLAVFNLPQRHLADALAALKSRERVVRVSQAEGQGSDAAQVVFVDNTVDAASGTVRVKARLDNKTLAWWPGAYVRVSFALQTIKGAPVIPTASIVQGSRGRSVFVVDSENKAQQKPVDVLQISGDFAAVKGIAEGDKVVLDGRQSLRPGAAVVERKAGGKSS